MTPAQCRMARAALSLGAREVADAARVTANTITQIERGGVLSEKTVAAVRAALERSGVEFIPENGGGAGVRLRKSPPAVSDEAAIPETPKGDPYDGSPM